MRYLFLIAAIFALTGCEAYTLANGAYQGVTALVDVATEPEAAGGP